MIFGIVIFLLIVVIYSIFAVWLGKRSITMPMFFLAVGALLGPFGLGWINFSMSSENVKVVVEITLALILFSDASTLKLHELRVDPSLPTRLLGLALPMIVFFGGIIALLFFPQEEIGFALLIGAILAPTDAALGLPIFTNKRVPVRIRRALNVESGLNDGIATPFVTLFTALAVAELSQKLSGWAASALMQIGIALAVGAVLGWLGGWLFSLAMHRRLTSRATEQVGTIALALSTYAVSVALGGNGFIAAFVGGLFFGYITRHKQHTALELTEGTGTVLSLLVWTVFGGLLVIPLITSFIPLALVYAILSLTLIRMLPVAISLIGTHFRRDTTLLMGWLGPRGLASVVFTLIAFEAFYEAGRAHDVLFSIAGWTILLSVLLHGFSALPLAHWYANRLKTAPATIPEMVKVPEVEDSHRRFKDQFTSKGSQEEVAVEKDSTGAEPK